eukprot:8087676-Ditylum_brightwellii.AAC.1
MQLALDSCIELINDNGGFTIVGWYKRGIINDQSILAMRKIVSNNINNISSNNNNGSNCNDNLQVVDGE